MKIAIFDSGAGGLTVLKSAQKLLNGQDLIYFADTKHLPYGEKKPELVKKYIHQAVDFLATKKIDALVIACNTATSLMIDELRNNKRYQFPIFGMEPAIKLAHDQTEAQEKILITGTQITINADRVKNLSQQFPNKIDFLNLGKLVHFVETENFNSKIINTYLKKTVSQAKQYAAVVLGCTHFSFFKKEFQDFFDPKTIIVDGNQGTVKHLIKQLNLKDTLGENNLTFYFSQEKDQKLEEKYRRLLKHLT